MKNILRNITYLLIGGLTMIGVTTFALNITVPSAPSAGFMLTSVSTGAYIATSTTPLYVGSFLATSTTQTNMIGGSLFGGAAPIAGLGTSNSQLVISQNINNLARQLDLANISTGANAEGGITFENANSTNAGASSAYIAGMVMGGPNFATAGFGGLAPNGLAIFNTDGRVDIGATSANAASSTVNFYAGNNGGFGGGIPDLTLTGGVANLGLGTTTPGARFGIQGMSGGTIPLLLISSSTAAAATSTVLTVTSTGGLVLSSFATTTANNGFNISAGCFSINNTCISGGGGSGTVTSVGLSDSNSTLTIGSTPVTTSGTITATLNLAHANTWTGLQTFNNATTTLMSSTYASSTLGFIGSLGVGATTTISGGKLQIIQSVDTNAGGLTVTNSSQGASNRIWMDATGNARIDAGGSAGGSILLNGAGVGKIGIGTTTPYATLSIQTGASTGDAFVVATSTGNAVMGVDNDGHTFTSGPVPVISSCGTGTGTVNGDDLSGTITTATAATACTMTFSKAYRLTPTCTVTDNSLVGFADIASISTSAVTFGISSALTGGNLYYNCQYHK